MADELHEAARYGKLPEVEMLLQAKADPNKLDRGDSPPLVWAAMSGKPEVTAALELLSAPCIPPRPTCAGAPSARASCPR